jgi:hypothetical protein
MTKITINLRNLPKNQSTITIPIGQTFNSIDTSEVAENQFIDDEIVKVINEIQDFEKLRFVPFNGINEIIIQLKDSGSTPMYYDEFGLSNSDLLFQRNRFKNSFIKLNFYDSESPTNKKLIHQMIIYNQINSDQRDISNDLLDVSLMPITYRLVDPITVRKGVSEGFYLYGLKTPIEAYPNNLYMTATYNNANDGKTTQLVAYDSPVAINQYNEVNSVKYVLSSVGNMQEYSVDDTDRTIDFSGSQMIIKLYKPVII